MLTRVLRAWRALVAEQRLAAYAALALLVSMFLPWYEKNVVVGTGKEGRLASDSLSAFGVFSFIEAAILLIGGGMLVLLFHRGEHRAFHLPGGDGTVVFAAGVWAVVLLVVRVFSRPDVKGAGSTVGIQWGFFVAFLAAGFLAYAGYRIRAADQVEPTAAQDPTTRVEPAALPTTRARPPADDDRSTGNRA